MQGRMDKKESANGALFFLYRVLFISGYYLYRYYL